MSGVLLTVIAITANSADRPVAAPIAEQRLKLAREAMRALGELERMREPVTSEQLYRWSHRLMQVELKVRANEADRTAAVTKHLERMKSIEERVEEGYRNGEISYFNLLEARWRRLEAEALLAELKIK
jgi:hypothetical protein